MIAVGFSQRMPKPKPTAALAELHTDDSPTDRCLKAKAKNEIHKPNARSDHGAILVIGQEPTRVNVNPLYFSESTRPASLTLKAITSPWPGVISTRMVSFCVNGVETTRI